MSTITWIIIILIVISIAVTVTEVGLRFAILEKESRAGKAARNVALPGSQNWTRFDFTAPQLEAICGKEIIGITFAGY